MSKVDLGSVHWTCSEVQQLFHEQGPHHQSDVDDSLLRWNMSRMLKTASEYEGDVDKVLSSCDVGKALGGINDNSRAGRPPLRKTVIEMRKGRHEAR